MMSGALQVAILDTLEGKLGLRGWRYVFLSQRSPDVLTISSWLFVINGVMTVLVGVAGFFMLPDYPNRPNPRAAWLTDEHVSLAGERLERHGRAEAKRITWESAK